MIEHIASLMSTPLGGRLEDEFPELAESYVEAIRYRVQQGLGVEMSVLDELISNPFVRPDHRYWRPEMGSIISKLHSGTAFDFEIAAVQFVLCACELDGVYDDVSFSLSSPADIYFSYYACRDTIQIKLSKSVVEIKSATGFTSFFKKSDSNWVLSPHTKDEIAQLKDRRLYESSGSEGITVFSGRDLARTPEWRLDETDTFYDASLDTVWPTLTRGLGLLETLGPRYINWVRFCVRGIALQKLKYRDEILSGSSPWFPGLLSLGIPTSAYSVGETLVHESAHQYLYFLERFGPVINGQDEKLYYSPLKEMSRPIHTILASYHAIVNMVMFHEYIMLVEGHENPLSRERADRYRAMANEYEGPLDATDGLTPSGRALYESLRKMNTQTLNLSDIGIVGMKVIKSSKSEAFV